MIAVLTNYSEPTDGAYDLSNLELSEWIKNMTNNGQLNLNDLKSERAATAKRLEELDIAIRVLESLSSNGNGRIQRTIDSVSFGPTEFARDGIAEAAVRVLKRAGKALHVSDIVKALQTGGYIFKGSKPINSVAPVLYMAAQNRKHGIVSMGKNTYSLVELEGKQ